MNTDNSAVDAQSKPDFGRRIAAWLGLILVVFGMINAMPTFPGLDSWAAEMVGDINFVFRRFPFEYLYPIAFLLMMTIVVFQHSFYRDRKNEGTNRRIVALLIDIGFFAATVFIVATYWTEIESVCVIDVVTGERQALMAKALAAEREMAQMMGMPLPETIENPACINTTGVWIFAIFSFALLMFLIYNVKVWGFSLVAVAMVVVAYTLGTVIIWYLFGADDISKYLATKLGGEPRTLVDGIPNVRDVLINSGKGLLGEFMGILLNVVFPYIVLGSLFGVSAGGQSLIRLAFLVTRKLRGGPAHAAIVSSALFGTISGGPVVNVMSTGVLTIPMMIKRGFHKTFAGGVEAAASSGGQIMPPVMGVAAFVLASITMVPYSEVIIAALIPSVAYFGALFLTVVFQARKQGIQAYGDVQDFMVLSGEDKKNLLMIFLPILTVLFILLSPKETIGCGYLGGLMGATQTITDGSCIGTDLPWILQLVQNSAGDAGSAGWWACALLIVLFFMDKNIRAQPRRLLEALSEAGILISTLYLMFLLVSIIDFSFNFTGLTNFIALDIVEWLKTFNEQVTNNGMYLFVALLVTMALAIILGMGMPTVPAYLNVALLMSPLLVGLGIATFSAHMFIFYFAVASAITPPVAVAAFAASSITKGDPIATGFAAVKAGIVMFVIPFVFAFYPELLLIPAAQIDPTSEVSSPKFLAGYDGTIHWESLIWLCARIAFALYLLASVLANFDRTRVGLVEGVIRLLAALLIVTDQISLCGLGIVVGFGTLYWNAKKASPKILI